MRHLRFIIALFCAEWLLIFRAWLSPSILFLLLLTAGFRLFALSVTPRWMGAYVVFYIAFISLLMHLRALLSGRGRRNRAIYETPETGVPWLVLVARNPKAALVLEIGISLAVVWIYFPYTPLRIPPEPWANPDAIATLSAFLGVCGLTLWNAVHNRVPKVDIIQPHGLSFKLVRQQSHRRPRLPSVKELADQFQREG
jgi:hypothetical protein